jgi:endonuclease YncB( thermonuclease family)
LALAVPGDRKQNHGRCRSRSRAGKRLTSRVVSIADGDTVTVLDSSGIRLEGINAPELHQSFGSRSKQNLSELILGRA